MQAIERASQEITAKRQVSIQSELLNADAPADCAPEVRAALAESCRQHGFRFSRWSAGRITIRFLFRGSRRLECFLFRAGTDTAIGPMKYAAPEDVARERWCWRRRWRSCLRDPRLVSFQLLAFSLGCVHRPPICMNIKGKDLRNLHFISSMIVKALLSGASGLMMRCEGKKIGRTLAAGLPLFFIKC